MILAVVMLAAVDSGPAQALHSLGMQNSASSPVPGDTVRVDLIVSGAEGLFLMNLDIAFDEASLSLIDVEPGSLLASGGLTLGALGAFSYDDCTLGEVNDISDNLLGPVPGVGGDGILATLVFEAIGTGSAVVDYLRVGDAAGTELLSSSGASLFVANAGGLEIMVQGEGATPMTDPLRAAEARRAHSGTARASPASPRGLWLDGRSRRRSVRLVGLSRAEALGGGKLSVAWRALGERIGGSAADTPGCGRCSQRCGVARLPPAVVDRNRDQ